MLPILKSKKQQTGLIVQERHSAEEQPEEMQEGSDEQSEELEACIKDLIAAYSLKDIKMIAESVKVIHDILHEHMDSAAEEPNNFALQNARAYKPQE